MLSVLVWRLGMEMRTVSQVENECLFHALDWAQDTPRAHRLPCQAQTGPHAETMAETYHTLYALGGMGFVGGLVGHQDNIP